MIVILVNHLISIRSVIENFDECDIESVSVASEL